MTDENTAPENREAPPTLPPKIFEQLARMQSASELPPEPPKRKSKVSVVLSILIMISAVILAFVFLNGPGNRAEVVPEASSSTPALPINPRMSVPVPADTEVDAAPVPPAGTDLLAQLDKNLTAEINRGEGGLKPLIAKASLGVLDPKHGLNEDDLKGQNPDAKALASAYQDMFKRMGENLGKDDQVLSDIDYLSGEQDRLAASLDGRKSLQITKVVLCQRVSGFGRYEQFPDNDFHNKSLPLILVYSELANFKTRAEDDGRFVVKLKEELSIDAASGESKEIWKEHEVSVTDAASSRRRDFFIAQYLNLPKTIEPGKYNLRVKITDEADGRVAVSVVPLTITAE